MFRKERKLITNLQMLESQNKEKEVIDDGFDVNFLPVPIERIFLHIISEIPEPLPGKMNVVFKLFWKHHGSFKVCKPAINCLSLFEVSLRPIF